MVNEPKHEKNCNPTIAIPKMSNQIKHKTGIQNTTIKHKDEETCNQYNRNTQNLISNKA